MSKVTPQQIVNLIKTFPAETQAAAERDLTPLMRPPYHDLNCRLHCQALSGPIGLLSYALRFGAPASVEMLLAAGVDPDAGTPRPLTILLQAQMCPDAGRLEKLELLLRRGVDVRYVETAERTPTTPLIAVARAKLGGIQRFWLAYRLRAAGALAHTTNDYELRVVARLLAELNALDGIMQCLSPEERQATKATPASFDGLVVAVVQSGNPLALRRMLLAKTELRIPIGFDPTAALLDLTAQIADRPVPAAQVGIIRALLEGGATAQSSRPGDTAFERALAFENHELINLFLDAGTKPELASAPDLVFEMMRREGLPQRAKVPVALGAPAVDKALAALNLLCSGVEGLEACPETDIDRLTADRSEAMRALARRLDSIAERLASAAPGLDS
jgi:hypothetical protein